MAERHKNKWLQVSKETIHMDIDIQALRDLKEHGQFHSWHELWAVLREEVDEFFESIKRNDVDPGELLQVAAIAQTGVLQICETARAELAANKASTRLGAGCDKSRR